jgi:hypothetical protein
LLILTVTDRKANDVVRIERCHVLRIVTSGMCALAFVLGAALPAAAAPAPAPAAAAPTTAPAGTTVRASSGVDLYIDTLSKISCGSAKACLAIGLYDNYRSGSDAPIAEAWNGKSWRSVAVPEPKGALAGDTTLSAVSCKSATSCLVVGNHYTASSFLPYALTWNGSSLKAAAAPLVPKNGLGVTMDALSCATARSCVAVGTSLQLAVETWNGAKWTLRTAAVPGETGNGVDDAPMAISCLSALSCVFAGGTYVGGSDDRTLLTTWNGRAFTPMKTAASAGLNGFTLSDVSCASAKSCVAVGVVANAAGTNWLGSTLVWNGRSWTAAKVAWPKGTVQAYLFGVSCPSPRNCVAVGTAGTADSVGAQSLSYNGTSWSRQRVPAPGNGASSTMSDVSCPRSGDCVAIGEVGDFNLNTATVMPRQMGGWWNGKTWALADA